MTWAPESMKAQILLSLQYIVLANQSSYRGFFNNIVLSSTQDTGAANAANTAQWAVSPYNQYEFKTHQLTCVLDSCESFENFAE